MKTNLKAASKAILALFASALMLLDVGCSSTPDKPKEQTAEGAAAVGFKLHNYETKVLENGLQVILVEDHSLPSVSYGVLIKDGASSDGMAKSGLAELTAQVLLKGSQKMNASQIADSLGQLGTEFEHDVSQDYMWFSVSGLTPHANTLLDIFSEVVLHPRFDLGELERERSIILAAIKQRPDHPDQFAGEAFSAYLFGGHPYARPISGLEPDIKSINRTDLFRAYKRFFRPNNAVLVVTGDFSPELVSSLESHFSRWEREDTPQKSFSLPPNFTGINIRLIDKPDLTQSQIIMGEFGIKRSDPDYLKLRVANTILGGNFSSRLMDQVRINLGLTYGISSSFDAELDRGPFQISTFTKNQSVGSTITESLKVLKKFCAEGVTQKEVEDAKNYMMGAFPRAIETPERLAFNLAVLRLYGINDDYLKNFVSNVNQVTVADINDAIKKHINPNDLKIVVFSKSSDALDQIRSLGLLEVKKFNEVF